MEVNDILREALALHQHGRVEAALEGYRRALDAAPDHPSALNFAGVALASLGRMDEAVASLRRCVGAAPDYADAHANLALALRALGRHEEALQAQEQVLRLSPGDAGALSETGITLRRLGRYQKAVETFRRAIAVDPGHAGAHANLGNVLQDLDRMEEAVDSYRAAIDSGAEQPSVYRGLGNALQRLHRDEEAVSAYRQALEVDPHYVSALTDLGGALVEVGRAGEGVACLRQAAALGDDDVTVHSNLAAALHETGDHEGALAEFDRALALDPGNTHALAFQSITLHHLGQFRRWRWLTGIDTFVRELELPPPPGYGSLTDLNDALAAFAGAHPSVWSGRRRGISSELFLDGEGPPVALRESIRAAVRRYMAELPADLDHPFVHRRPDDFVLSGWCNILDEGAPSHIHPNAWLSGVYYVRTEGVVGDAQTDRSGCLQVGAPDEKHYHVEDYPVRVFRPREGRLVVFPSYVWHRILPFQGRGQRISYAFDVIPSGRAQV